MTSWYACAVVLMCALGGGFEVVAQNQASADAAEIAAYRLTLPNLRKVINVNRIVLQALMKDPKVLESLKIDREIDALSKKDQPTDTDRKRIDELEARKEQLEESMDNPLGGSLESLSEMESRITNYLPMAEALRRENLTPREYATFWLTFLKAAFSHGFQKSGMLKQLPADVSPENVQFIAAHEAEIAAMQQELERLGRRR